MRGASLLIVVEKVFKDKVARVVQEWASTGEVLPLNPAPARDMAL